MTGTIGSGIPGLTLDTGDHLCGFYRGAQERDAMLLPFLRAGLEAGDPCVCALERPAEHTGLAALRAEHDAGEAELLVLDARETYLPDGRYDLDDIVARWHALVTDLGDRGHVPHVRAAGDLSWLAETPDRGRTMLAFERMLDGFLPERVAIALCMYDVDALDGELLVPILRTHRKVWMRGMVIENAFYVAGDGDGDGAPHGEAA